uniref:Uncharacterized protein n=1 Tax=Daucus carota subsp. sativus TaxID=79200 RepID=A0A161XX01_DAUCS
MTLSKQEEQQLEFRERRCDTGFCRYKLDRSYRKRQSPTNICSPTDQTQFKKRHVMQSSKITARMRLVMFRGTVQNHF